MTATITTPRTAADEEVATNAAEATALGVAVVVVIVVAEGEDEAVEGIRAWTTMSDRDTEVVGCNTSSIDIPALPYLVDRKI